MMLGPIICSVVFARAPIEFELLLGFAATEPMETHVHRFGATGLDVVVDDSKCGTVVGFDWGFGLFVAHLCEELAYWNCFTGIDVKCSKLGFGGA